MQTLFLTLQQTLEHTITGIALITIAYLTYQTTKRIERIARKTKHKTTLIITEKTIAIPIILFFLLIGTITLLHAFDTYQVGSPLAYSEVIVGCKHLEQNNYYTGRSFTLDFYQLKQDMQEKGFVCRETAPTIKCLCDKYNQTCQYYSELVFNRDGNNKTIRHIGILKKTETPILKKNNQIGKQETWEKIY